jgi:hypothetical protein
VPVVDPPAFLRPVRGKAWLSAGDSEHDSWKVLVAVGRAADAMPEVGDRDCAHFVAVLYANDTSPEERLYL